ncbi:MAG: NAD(P)/FAD-dependent oxidoreductase [Hyphomicrobiaceae bacterium]
MTGHDADLIVIGAGPAGASAALAAVKAGLKVVLIDEAHAAGGQIYRAPSSALAAGCRSAGRDGAEGDRLRASLADAEVRFVRNTRVWSVSERFRVDAAGPDGACCFRAPRLVAASGAYERVVPFPGWTLPGVMGLAAATILLKSEAMLPGRNVVVAGAGPLLAAVASKVAQAGGAVAAVVDVAPRREWLAMVPGLASRVDLLREGAGWVLNLARRGVPYYAASAIQKVERSGSAFVVTIGRVTAEGARIGGEPAAVIEGVDAVLVGNGLVPGGEITKLCGAEHFYDRLAGGWVPVLDACGRTSISGLYATGDGAAIRGAAPALVSGALAGLAAARDSGRIDNEVFERLSQPLKNDARRLAPFARAVASMMALRPAQVADIAPDTIVCRCEDVTRAEIETALDDGAVDVNQVKHFTRCGMGPCQGRMCGDVVGELVARRVGSREAAGVWTPRAPLRPVALGELVGSYTYDDIPIPRPAPL